MKELSLHILDIAKNSVKAKASLIEIIIIEDEEKNLLSIGIPLADISRMISGNPARLNGLFEETGSIEEGKLADLTVTDDEGNIFMTIINGEIEFNGML